MDIEKNKKELDALSLWPHRQPARFDVITPHKITVVFLFQEYLHVKQEISDRFGVSFPNKYRRQFSMLVLKLIQYPDLPYKELYALLQSPTFGIHPAHLKAFENLMEILSTMGIEVLLDLQKFVERLMSENIGINQFGILGQYIRRIVLMMDRLKFPDMMELYKQIKTYYDRGIRAIAIAPTNQQNVCADDTLDMNPHLIRNTPNKWSVKQSDLFVAQQCNLLENNEQLALTPIELAGKITEIHNDNPLYSQAHMLSYLNNLRVRDLFNANDVFHRAFERSVARSHAPQETKGFQYSALNLAIMHSQFGHSAEALVALRECVMLAQECGDRICLQLAHSWLCLLDKNNVQLCEKSVASQTELSLVHSVSLGVQFIVNVAAVSGFLPSKLFELLMKSEVINFQHSLNDLMANCIAQKAAVWTLYGRNEIASLCSQLLLHVVRTHRKRENDSMENGESVCHSLCCVALWLSLRGEYSLSAVVLQHARERFRRHPLASNWMICDAYITSIQAIYRGRWDEATEACCTLYTLDPVLSLLQRAMLHIMRRNLNDARRIVDRLLDDEHLEPLNRVRAMVLLANTRDDRNAADAVNVLNEASVFARSMYLAYETALIDVNLAYVLFAMQMPGKALKTIRRCMETILADGGVYDCARTSFLFVRCLVAVERSLGGQAKRLDECAEILATVVEQFRKVEAVAKMKDVYVWLAQTNDRLERRDERNRWARKFRELERWAPTPVECLNVFF